MCIRDSPDVLEQVAVLATTSEIPNDSVSFTADFPAEMRAEIIAALLDISASAEGQEALNTLYNICLLYTSDAADERSSVDLGGRRILKKNKKKNKKKKKGIVR